MKTTLTTVILIGILSLGMSLSVQCQQINSKPPQESTTRSSVPLPEGRIPANLVCFPNNRYMGKEQISVNIEGKTYYGCCMGCIGKLKSQPEQRYARDPFSGKKIDKSEAYIVIKPGSTTAEVLYFESEKNYSEFIQNISK